MTGLFGALKPTFSYSRFVWGDTTLDFDDPSVVAMREMTPVLLTAVSDSGFRQVLKQRLDQGVTLTTPLLKPAAKAQVERMLYEWVADGKQVEVFVDRTLRAFWGFEDEAIDHNKGNPWIPSDASVLSYVMLTDGRGLSLPSSGILRAALVSTLPGGSGNKFFGPAEGLLVVLFKPDWAAGDGLEHVLLDCVVEANHGTNRLMVKKRADNNFYVVSYGSNGAATILQTTAPAWSANTEHTLMVQWGATLAKLKAKLDGMELATTKYMITFGGGKLYGNTWKYGQLTVSAAGNEAVMNAGPDRASLGIDFNGIMGRSTGAVGRLALYQATYPTDLPESLLAHEVVERTYFPKGEFVDQTFVAQRPMMGRQLYAYQFRIRDGR